MADKQNKRNSYADLGLVVAVTFIVVVILRALIFDISWEDGFWLILAGAYCIVSYKFDSESKIIKNTTTAFLTVTAVSLVAMFFIDHKPQPTMHAFEGANTDTIAEEEFIVKDDPQLPVILPDTAEVDSISDTILTEEIEPETEPEESITSEETDAQVAL